MPTPMTLENRSSYIGGHVYTCGHYTLCGDHVQLVKENHKCWDCMKKKTSIKIKKAGEQ